MAEKTVKARIQLKCDTEDHWNLAIHFVPLYGELIIYSADGAHTFSRLKVGDGTTPVTDLPFTRTNTSNIFFNTSEYWSTQGLTIPEKDTIMIYEDEVSLPSGMKIPRMKIGDGKAYLVDLPFVGDDVLYKLNSHMSNKEIHITAAERAFWNDKLNCNEELINDTLVFNRN